MTLHRIGGHHEKVVLAVIEDLLDYAKEHGMTSFQFIAEIPGQREPLDGVVGRFRADPHRLIGQLTIVQSKLVRLVATRVPPE